MKFSLIIFQWRAMMVTVQMLSVRNIQYELEKCYYSISFLKPATNQSPALDISRDLSTQYISSRISFDNVIANRPFAFNSFFRPKPISKVAIVKTKSAIIACFSSPPFLLLSLSFSPFLFLRYYDFGASWAYETCLLTLFHSNDCKFP